MGHAMHMWKRDLVIGQLLWGMEDIQAFSHALKGGKARKSKEGQSANLDHCGKMWPLWQRMQMDHLQPEQDGAGSWYVADLQL